MNSYSSGGGYYNNAYPQPMMGAPMMAPGVAPVMGTPVMGTPVVGAPMMPAMPMMPGGVRGLPGCMKCMGTGMKMSKKWGQMKPCKTCMRMLRVPGYF